MDRNTWDKDGQLFPVPVDKTKIDAGCLTFAGTTGYGTNAPGTANTILGVSTEAVDNSAGSAGDLTVLVRRKLSFCLDNDTAAPVTLALLGKNCYALNSTTVTASATSHPVVGKVLEVSPDGVWVYID